MQMRFQKSICHRDKSLVPAIIARLISADKKNGGPQRIESVQRAERPAAALRSQFAHLRIARGDYSGTMWKPKRGTECNNMTNGNCQAILLVLA